MTQQKSNVSAPGRRWDGKDACSGENVIMREKWKLLFYGEAWKIEVRNWEAVGRDYYLEYGGKYQKELKVFLSGEKKIWGRERRSLIIYFLCDKNNRLKKRKGINHLKFYSQGIVFIHVLLPKHFWRTKEHRRMQGDLRDTLTSSLRPDSMVSRNQKRLLREKTRLPWPSVSLLLVVIKWKSSADLHFRNLVHKSLTGQLTPSLYKTVFWIFNHWLWLSSLSVFLELF